MCHEKTKYSLTRTTKTYTICTQYITPNKYIKLTTTTSEYQEAHVKSSSYKHLVTVETCTSPAVTGERTAARYDSWRTALCRCGSFAPSPRSSSVSGGHSRLAPCCDAEPLATAQESAEFERSRSLTGSLVASWFSLDGESKNYTLQ